MKLGRALWMPLLLSLAVPSVALAYVDPGAGSMLMQLLLGGVAGLLIAARLWGRKIARFFGLGKDRDHP